MDSINLGFSSSRKREISKGRLKGKVHQLPKETGDPSVKIWKMMLSKREKCRAFLIGGSWALFKGGERDVAALHVLWPSDRIRSVALGERMHRVRGKCFPCVHIR